MVVHNVIAISYVGSGDHAPNIYCRAKNNRSTKTRDSSIFIFTVIYKKRPHLQGVFLRLFNIFSFLIYWIVLLTSTQNHICMERVMGIEPTTSAWKAEVLPLNYTRTISSSMPAVDLSLDHVQEMSSQDL